MRYTPAPLRALLSFAYYAKSIDQALDVLGPSPSIMADSGGFTAMRSGTPIDIKDYAAWLDAYGDAFEACANLDEIGDAETTWKNHKQLERLTHRPILPVVHFGEPTSVLDRYYRKGHRYILLGGLVAVTGKARLRWVVQCFKWARDRGDVAFHGFGMTNWATIGMVPWYSIDSSSLSASQRFGILYLFDPNLGRFVVLPMKWAKRAEVSRNAHAKAYEYAQQLRDWGFDPAMLSEPSSYQHGAVTLNAMSYRYAEAWLRAHRPAVVRADTHDEGPRIYLASSGVSMYRRIKEHTP